MVWLFNIAGNTRYKFSGENAAALCKSAWIAIQNAFGEHAAACVLQVAI